MRFGESLTSFNKNNCANFSGEKKKNHVAFRGVYFWRIHEKVLSQISFWNLKDSVLTECETLRGTFVQKPLFKGTTLVTLRDEV